MGSEPPARTNQGGNPDPELPAGKHEGNVPTLQAPATAREASRGEPPPGSLDPEPTRIGRRYLSFLAIPTDLAVPLNFLREPQYPFHSPEWDKRTRHKQLG